MSCRIAHGVARAVGSSTAVIDQARSNYAALTDAGHGDADTSALILRKRGP